MILGWSNKQGLKKLQREERQEAVATGTGSDLFDDAEAEGVTVCDTGYGTDREDFGSSVRSLCRTPG